MVGAIVASAVIAIAPPASAQPEPGTCVPSFSAVPDIGSEVFPGRLIIVQVDMAIQGDLPVFGCEEDLRISGPLDFMKALPDGAFFPDSGIGPIATVDFLAGPYDPGTVQHGKLMMRVKVDAPVGASVVAGPTLYTVGARPPSSSA
jgi:hypothetical protein